MSHFKHVSTALAALGATAALAGPAQASTRPDINRPAVCPVQSATPCAAPCQPYRLTYCRPVMAPRTSALRPPPPRLPPDPPVPMFTAA